MVRKPEIPSTISCTASTLLLTMALVLCACEKQGESTSESANHLPPLVEEADKSGDTGGSEDTSDSQHKPPSENLADIREDDTSQGGASNDGDNQLTFVPSDEPVAITGMNLLDVKTQCLTKRDDTQKKSTMTCQLGFIKNSDMGLRVLSDPQFVPATALAQDISVEWEMTRRYGSMFVADYVCETSKNGVVFTCSWGEANNAVSLEVTYAILQDEVLAASETVPVKFLNECEGLTASVNYDAFGDGTAEYPYLWCFSEQFVDFANLRCNDVSQEGCSAHVRLGNDLDGTLITKSIASMSGGYSGHFHGNGYTIHGISLAGNQFGIFARITEGALLDYVNFRDIDITGDLSGGVLATIVDEGATLHQIRITSSTLTIDPYDSGPVGAIVGTLSGNLSDSFSDAELFVGSGYTGGLVGVCTATCIIERSASETIIEPQSSGVTMGGLVGSLQGVIVNSYSQSRVGGYQAGGLVGLGRSGFEIRNSYAAGLVFGGTLGGLVGGVTFEGEYDFESTYFDKDLAGLENVIGGNPSPPPDPPGATGETTAAMKLVSTYQGWDFDAVWSHDDGEYPRLRSLANPTD